MAIDWDAEVLGPVMAVFGEAVLYLPRYGSPISIPDAVFDEESSEIQIGEDAQVATQRKPVLGIRAALVPGAAQSDRVQIVRTGTMYVVKDVEPDGHGHLKLSLMLAA